MERASGLLYQRQRASSRQREEQLRQQLPTTTLVRKLAGATGRKVDDHQAAKPGSLLHYGLGASGGPALVVLMWAAWGRWPPV